MNEFTRGRSFWPPKGGSVSRPTSSVRKKGEGKNESERSWQEKQRLSSQPACTIPDFPKALAIVSQVMHFESRISGCLRLCLVAPVKVRRIDCHCHDGATTSKYPCGHLLREKLVRQFNRLPDVLAKLPTIGLAEGSDGPANRQVTTPCRPKRV